MKRLNIGKESILKLTGSVYGLRNAPRAWYQRVKKDLEALGWRCQQLDQCVFLKYDGEELVGICGVYVDDFIIAGKQNSKTWQTERDKLRKLYKWGNWETDTSTLCGVKYTQRKDIPVRCINKNLPPNSQPQTLTSQRTYINSTERINWMRPDSKLYAE